MDPKSARRKILDASATLFSGAGYSATTIKQIAAEAGVAVQTVYFVFGNKRSILASVLDVAVAGDDERIGTLERTWVADAIAAPTAAGQLRIHAAAAREICSRVAGILLAVRAAAGTDSDIAELWRTNVEQRVTVLRHLMEALASKAPGMDIERCVDIGLVVSSPETYSLLVEDRQWSAQTYEDWFVECLSTAAGCAR